MHSKKYTPKALHQGTSLAGHPRLRERRIERRMAVLLVEAVLQKHVLLSGCCGLAVTALAHRLGVQACPVDFLDGGTARLIGIVNDEL